MIFYNPFRRSTPARLAAAKGKLARIRQDAVTEIEVLDAAIQRLATRAYAADDVSYEITQMIGEAPVVPEVTE